MPTERTRADRARRPARHACCPPATTSSTSASRPCWSGWRSGASAPSSSAGSGSSPPSVGSCSGLLVAHLVDRRSGCPSVVTLLGLAAAYLLLRRAARGPRPPRRRRLPHGPHLPRPGLDGGARLEAAADPAAPGRRHRHACSPCRSSSGWSPRPSPTPSRAAAATGMPWWCRRWLALALTIVLGTLEPASLARAGRRLRPGRDRLDDRAQHPVARRPCRTAPAAAPAPAIGTALLRAGRGRRPARRAAPARHRRRPAPGGAHRAGAAVRHRASSPARWPGSASTPSPTTPSSSTPSCCGSRARPRARRCGSPPSTTTTAACGVPARAAGVDSADARHGVPAGRRAGRAPAGERQAGHRCR